MKVVILCGGEGTRLRELTEKIPKPLIEIGDMPVLWHLMKMYSHYGLKDFIFCLGYKGDKIKEYFVNYDWKNNDFSIKEGKLETYKSPEEWNIIFADTGRHSTKAERLLKIKDYLGEDEDFLVSYGDDLSDVNISKLIEFHKEKRKLATITTFQLNSPFGVVEITDDGLVKKFKEKPLMNDWINGGFMILNKKVLEEIHEGEDLEKEVFERLVSLGEICAYKHKGFWKSMTTFKDNQDLNKLWNDGKAYWKVWMD